MWLDDRELDDFGADKECPTRARFNRLFPQGVYVTVAECQRVAGEFNWNTVARILLTRYELKAFNNRSESHSWEFAQREDFMLRNLSGKWRSRSEVHRVNDDTYSHFQARLFAELFTERNRMAPTIKQRFLEALRSGRYKQINSYLRLDDCHCLLGVLCDVVDPDGWGRPVIVCDDGLHYAPQQGLSYRHHDKYGTPTDDVMEVAELTTQVVAQFTRMNDTWGWSFDRCADWIEENL